MDLLILGRGKTGSLVAKVARQRAHNVHAVGSAENSAGEALVPEKLRDIDVVIDFTTPDAVIHNITAAIRAKKSMVVGTTGWQTHLPQVRELVGLRRTGFVYGANFSVGVNLFYEIVRAASAAPSFGYAARIMERHYAQKKDSPSGTAAAIQSVFAEAGAKPEIASVREGDTIGTHAVLLDSAHDTIMLTHDAKSRLSFAEGAVLAAEWIHHRTGFFDFKDIYRELLMTRSPDPPIPR